MRAVDDELYQALIQVDFARADHLLRLSANINPYMTHGSTAQLGSLGVASIRSRYDPGRGE